MTIKGLWEEVDKVSPGKKKRLADLSSACFHQNGRPLRIAVDTPLAIFQFKEATKVADIAGGMNHTTRTFYFHVLHLLAAGVQPLFIFDGPGKPPEKGARHPATVRPCRHIASPSGQSTAAPAHVRISASSARTPTDIACERELSHVIPLCRNILDHLGIPHRDAAGEAEAECAALEKAGIADAVLTRDGDAFVFGSRTVLQKCDAEDKTAMVRQFKMSDMERAQPVLRRQDLFLLAMMAGGDYSHGISGCGPNIALEAARQGFGSELELLVKHRPESLRRWRDKLVEELRHNDRNRFSRKWVAVANAIHAQSNFPSPRIAEYYLKPAVSPRLDELQVNWTKATSVAALRQWTEEYFDWRYALHAGKFVRVLALPLLTKRLLAHIASQTDGSFLVNSVTSSKEGGLSPAEQELRVEFQPSKVVDIDISAEVVHEGYRANMKRVFDPNSLVREWIPRWIIEHGAPAAFRQWQARVGDSGRSASKAKRKASVSSPAAVPKRRRGRPPKNLPLGAPSRVSETPFLDGEFDGGNSQEFPAIFDLVRSPATTTQGHGTTSASVTAPRPARGQSEVIDLTSD